MSAHIRTVFALLTVAFVVTVASIVSVANAAAAKNLQPISNHQAQCTTMLLNARYHVQAMVAAENAGDEKTANAEADVANGWMNDYQNAGCNR